MIKAIREELEDIVAENYIEEKGLDWCANLILLRIEEAGMLPPLTNVKNAWGVDGYIRSNEWDEED